MINGGPCTNYYSGAGGGSEYSTTIINCVFQFCRVECEAAYKSFFDTAKALPETLFGMAPLIPATLGSDRSRAIVNAALETWPETHCVYAGRTSTFI